MSELTPTPGLVEAQENLSEAERIIGITTSSLIERLTEVTGGNMELVKDLMQDVTNIAGHAGTLAVAKRRVSSEAHKTDDPNDLHPDKMPAQQDSRLYGREGVQPILSAVGKIKLE